jgi:hypothetical protein
MSAAGHLAYAASAESQPSGDIVGEATIWDSSSFGRVHSDGHPRACRFLLRKACHESREETLFGPELTR